MVGRASFHLIVQPMFALTGVVTTLLGPLLPILVSSWKLDDAQAGLLFTLQFAGSVPASAVAGVAVGKIGFRATLTAGVGSMAVGVAALAASQWPLGAAAVFCYGIGLGLTIPTTNLLVADQFAHSRASALSLLNLSWGVGAVAAPPVVALLTRADGSPGAQVFLVGVASALFLSAATLRGIIPATGVSTRAEAAVPATWAALLFGAFLFLYVGTETTVGGWIAVYAGRIDAMSPAAAVALPSIFWGALLVGRGLAPWTLRRWSSSQLLGACLLLATGGVIALLLAGSGGTLALSVAVVGLGLSAIFPLTFALLTEDLERDTTRAAGPVFVLAALGGATQPWLVGIVSERTESLWSGLVVPLGGCAGMLILYLVRTTGRSGARPLH